MDGILDGVSAALRWLRLAACRPMAACASVVLSACGGSVANGTPAPDGALDSTTGYDADAVDASSGADAGRDAVTEAARHEAASDSGGLDGAASDSARSDGGPADGGDDGDGGGGVEGAGEGGLLDGGGTCACTLPNPSTGTVYLGGQPFGACPTSFQFDGVANYWFGYTDGTVDGGAFLHQADIGGCDHPGNCAFHTLGAGYTGFGAGAGFPLANNVPFDASGYAGMDVWLRGTARGTRGPGSIPEEDVVHVKFVTQASDGSDPRKGDDYGAYCHLPGADAGACYRLCHMPFAALARDGSKSVDAGAPDPATDTFDPQNLAKIQFELSSYMPADSDAATEPVSFDVWIDAVAFFPPHM
jgi:hypothetical protein